jgi:hypothetical protein
LPTLKEERLADLIVRTGSLQKLEIYLTENIGSVINDYIFGRSNNAHVMNFAQHLSRIEKLQILSNSTNDTAFSQNQNNPYTDFKRF